MLTALLAKENAKESSPELFFKEAFVREDTDKPWAIVLKGEIASLAGCYIIVHNTQGRQLAIRHVESGRYPSEAPFRIEIAVDGETGDYRVLIVGHQQDVMGVKLPMTTLDYEVYGSDNFAARNAPSLWFQIRPGEEQSLFSGHSGAVRVKDGENVVLQTQIMKGGKGASASTTGKVQLQPGRFYQLEIMDTFYFSIKPNPLLAFDPRRWFLPNSDVGQVAWWQLTEEKP